MTKTNPFRDFKTSPEVIRLVVMRYFRFLLSLRNVDGLLHDRGIEISDETVRSRWNRLGSMFAGEIKKRRIQGMRSSKWKWHLDEVFVKINGKMPYLWRAIDHEGEALESYVTKRRDRGFAEKLLNKLLRRHAQTDEFVIDRLRSYCAAFRDLYAPQKQRAGRWRNNRAENSHLPFRRRDRAMLRFRQMRCLQKFVSDHASVYNHFNQERSLSRRDTFKLNRTADLTE